MTRLFLFVVLYVIALLLGFQIRARYDEYMMRKPHMQARLHIFAQECLLYDPESVPEDERDALFPPSTTDSFAFNSALALRAVAERQAELDAELNDVAPQGGGAPPAPGASPEDAGEPGDGFGREDAAAGAGYASEPVEVPVEVPVEEADAVTSFGVPAPPAPEAGAPSQTAEPPLEELVVEEAPPLAPAPGARARADARVDPGREAAAAAPPEAGPAPGLELDDQPPGLEEDDPALSVLAELGEDLPVDGVETGYGQPVPDGAADPAADVDLSEAVDPAEGSASPSAGAEAPGGAYAGLVAAMEAQEAGAPPPAAPSPPAAPAAGDAPVALRAEDSGRGAAADATLDSAYASLPPGVGQPRENPAGPAPASEPSRERSAPVPAASAPVRAAASAPAVPESVGPPAPGAADREPASSHSPAISRRVLAGQRAERRAAEAIEPRSAAEGARDLKNLGPGVSFTPARSRRRRTARDS